MNQAMTNYIMETLDLDERSAFELRQHYWRVYGATLKGLMRHHNINPHHFLDTTHGMIDLDNLVSQTKKLRHCIQKLSGRKVVFTNAPMSYALRVLELLGIRNLFEHIFSVESTRFHPKPAIRGFRRLLKKINAKASDCFMMEDNLPTLMTAYRLGMRTIFVSKALHKPNYVNARIPDINKLIRTYI